MLQQGGGAKLVSAIRDARRALVFISVPWSAPERMARQEFCSAAAMLEENHADLRIACFRLDVDEDEASQLWLTSAGYPEFAIMGAGSLLWLQSGRVLATESNALSVGALGIVTRSTSLWPNLTESAIEPN